MPSFPSKLAIAILALDLLFFHRGLNSLVAFELKVGRFEPEYLGKLSFYLEALDRDVKKPHEHPSIGVLLCASKDEEVVEYALNRTLSPALIAEYQMQLPDKKLLEAKLQEFYLQCESRHRRRQMSFRKYTEVLGLTSPPTRRWNSVAQRYRPDRLIGRSFCRRRYSFNAICTAAALSFCPVACCMA